MRNHCLPVCVLALLASWCLAGTTLSQNATPASFAPYPNPDAGYVTDLAGVLSVDQEERIEQSLWKAEEEAGLEVAVVTIESIHDYPNTGATTIERFATGLFDAYGVGNMPDNNGVLLLVAVGDREARIELGAGHGRSRDADADRIMQRRIVPAFKRGDYAGGITAGVVAIISAFAGMDDTGLSAETGGVATLSDGWRSLTPGTIIAAVVALPLLAAVAVSLFRHGKRGWGWVVVGVIIVILLWLARTGWIVARHVGESGGGSSSGSWSSGGFGGGFGVGFSGGGGASGSW